MVVGGNVVGSNAVSAHVAGANAVGVNRVIEVDRGCSESTMRVGGGAAQRVRANSQAQSTLSSMRAVSNHQFFSPNQQPVIRLLTQSFHDKKIMQHYFARIPEQGQALEHSSLEGLKGCRVGCDEQGVRIRTNIFYKPGLINRVGISMLNGLLGSSVRAERFVKSRAVSKPVILVIRDNVGKTVALTSGFTDQYGEIKLETDFAEPLASGQYRAELFSPDKPGAPLAKVAEVEVDVEASLQKRDRSISSPVSHVRTSLTDEALPSNQLAVFDVDNTLYPSSFLKVKFNYNGLLDGQNESVISVKSDAYRQPEDYRFYKGIPEMAHALEQKGRVLTVSASPTNLIGDLSTVFGHHSIASKGGLNLKNWAAHAPALKQQFAYKIEAILQHLAKAPSGTRIDFIGDDKEVDADIYLQLASLIEGKITGEALAASIQQRTGQPLPHYSPKAVEALAEKVQQKSHRVGDILIRQYQTDKKRLPETLRAQVVYVQNGFDMAVHMLLSGKLSPHQFKSDVVKPLIERARSERSVESALNRNDGRGADEVVQSLIDDVDRCLADYQERQSWESHREDALGAEEGQVSTAMLFADQVKKIIVEVGQALR